MGNNAKQHKIMFICDRLMTTEQNTDSSLLDLKTARENSGLTLKELFFRTRISAINLEAIENGHFHLLPVPIYTRNFIKTYADALGVDPEPSLRRYEDYLEALKIKEKAKADEHPPQAPLAAALDRHKTALWIFCIVAVFAAVSFFINIQHKPSPAIAEKAHQPRPDLAQPQTQPPADPGPVTAVLEQLQPEHLVVQAPAAKAQRNINKQTSAAQDDSETRPEAIGEEPAAMIIRATEETWIRIQADDKEPYQVLLKPGEKISHKATRFNMDIGNAGGIRIQFDGKNIENLGKSGQVIHLRLP